MEGAVEEGDDIVSIPIYVPDLKLQKSLSFRKSELIWDVKQQVLASLPKEVRDGLNYGLYCPPGNGRAGKFLDEERRLGEYPLPELPGYLELRYKQRLYKTNFDEKQIRSVHSKTNLKRILEYVSGSHVDKITKLCSRGFDPNFTCSDTGETPLSAATVLKSPARVLISLVNGGALLDFRSRDGTTALHRAVERNCFEAVKTLLELGAGPNYKDSRGLTPLYYSVAGAGCDPQITELLLHERAAPGAADPHGWQEVHQACRHGLVQHLEHLLYYGAALDARNASGNTPLHVCAVNDQESCARVLLFRGADKDAFNFANQTAHQVAVIAGNLRLADIIQAHRQEDVVPYKEAPRYNPRRRRSSLGTRAASPCPSNNSQPGAEEVAEAEMEVATTVESPPAPGALCICVEEYRSSVPGHLRLLAQGDLVEVLAITEGGLLEGRTKDGTEGLFPSSCVHLVKFRPAPSRNPLPKKWKMAGEPRTVVLHKGKKGFGFVLRGAKATSPLMERQPSEQWPSLQYLDDVDLGGVAHLAGLKKGDFLLEINGQDVSQASHEQVVATIRQSGDLVTMTVVTVVTATGPPARQCVTLPRKLSAKKAPAPPKRDPRTTLSVGRARARSMVAGLAEIDAIDRSLNEYDSEGRSTKSSSVESLPHRSALLRRGFQSAPDLPSAVSAGPALPRRCRSLDDRGRHTWACPPHHYARKPSDADIYAEAFPPVKKGMTCPPPTHPPPPPPVGQLVRVEVSHQGDYANVGVRRDAKAAMSSFRPIDKGYESPDHLIITSKKDTSNRPNDRSQSVPRGMLIHQNSEPTVASTAFRSDTLKPSKTAHTKVKRTNTAENKTTPENKKIENKQSETPLRENAVENPQSSEQKSNSKTPTLEKQNSIWEPTQNDSPEHVNDKRTLSPPVQILNNEISTSQPVKQTSPPSKQMSQTEPENTNESASQNAQKSGTLKINKSIKFQENSKPPQENNPAVNKEDLANSTPSTETRKTETIERNKLKQSQAKVKNEIIQKSEAEKMPPPPVMAKSLLKEGPPTLPRPAKPPSQNDTGKICENPQLNDEDEEKMASKKEEERLAGNVKENIQTFELAAKIITTMPPKKNTEQSRSLDDSKKQTINKSSIKTSKSFPKNFTHDEYAENSSSGVSSDVESQVESNLESKKNTNYSPKINVWKKIEETVGKQSEALRSNSAAEINSRTISTTNQIEPQPKQATATPELKSIMKVKTNPQLKEMIGTTITTSTAIMNQSNMTKPNNIAPKISEHEINSVKVQMSNISHVKALNDQIKPHHGDVPDSKMSNMTDYNDPSSKMRMLGLSEVPQQSDISEAAKHQASVQQMNNINSRAGQSCPPPPHLTYNPASGQMENNNIKSAQAGPPQHDVLKQHQSLPPIPHSESHKPQLTQSNSLYNEAYISGHLPPPPMHHPEQSKQVYNMPPQEYITATRPYQTLPTQGEMMTNPTYQEIPRSYPNHPNYMTSDYSNSRSYYVAANPPPPHPEQINQRAYNHAASAYGEIQRSHLPPSNSVHQDTRGYTNSTSGSAYVEHGTLGKGPITHHIDPSKIRPQANYQPQVMYTDMSKSLPPPPQSAGHMDYSNTMTHSMYDPTYMDHHRAAQTNVATLNRRQWTKQPTDIPPNLPESREAYMENGHMDVNRIISRREYQQAMIGSTSTVPRNMKISSRYDYPVDKTSRIQQKIDENLHLIRLQVDSLGDDRPEVLVPPPPEFAAGPGREDPHYAQRMPGPRLMLQQHLDYPYHVNSPQHSTLPRNALFPVRTTVPCSPMEPPRGVRPSGDCPYSPTRTRMAAGGAKEFRQKIIHEWSGKDVSDWLESIFLPEYQARFAEAGITGAKLAAMDHNALLGVGVLQPGHRANMERSIKWHLK